MTEPKDTNQAEWRVYLVRCADRSLYCGVARDVERRVAQHNRGRGAKYTRSRLPVEIAALSPPMSKGEALKLEYRIKRLPSDRKIGRLVRPGNDPADRFDE